MCKLMVDLDGTLFPTYQTLNVIHKVLFKGDEIDWQALPDATNPYWVTEKGEWLKGMFNNDFFYAELLAYKGAREVLRIWMKNLKNQIIYCSSRSPCLESATAYSLGRNNLPYGDIFFVERKGLAKNKLFIVKTEGVDIAIDDEAEIMLELKDSCITIIYSQSYNQTYPFGFRVRDWYDVHKILKEFAGSP